MKASVAAAHEGALVVREPTGGGRLPWLRRRRRRRRRQNGECQQHWRRVVRHGALVKC